MNTFSHCQYYTINGKQKLWTDSASHYFLEFSSEKPDETEENESSEISKSNIKPRNNLNLDIPSTSITDPRQFPEIPVNIHRLGGENISFY